MFPSVNSLYVYLKSSHDLHHRGSNGRFYTVLLQFNIMFLIKLPANFYLDWMGVNFGPCIYFFLIFSVAEASLWLGPIMGFGREMGTWVILSLFFFILHLLPFLFPSTNSSENNNKFNAAHLVLLD